MAEGRPKRARVLATVAAILLLLRGVAFAGDASAPPSFLKSKEGDRAAPALLRGGETPGVEPAVRSEEQASAITTSSGQPRPVPWATYAVDPGPARPPSLDPTEILLVQARILEQYLDYRESLSVP